MRDDVKQIDYAPEGHELAVRFELEYVGRDATFNAWVLSEAIDEAGFHAEAEALRNAALKAQQFPFREKDGWTIAATSDDSPGVLHYFADLAASVCSYNAQPWRDTSWVNGKANVRSALYDLEVAIERFTLRLWCGEGDSRSVPPRVCRRCKLWITNNEA